MLFRRHWICASSALILGILSGWKFDISPGCGLFLASIAILITLLSTRLTNTLVVANFWAIGILFYSLNPYPTEGDEVFKYLLEVKPNSYIEAEGIVIDTKLPDKENHTFFVLAVNKIRVPGKEWKRINGNLQVYVNDNRIPIYVHQKLRVLGKSSLYLSPTNFDIHGYEDYLRSHRVYSRLTAYDSDMQPIGYWILSPLYWSSRIQYSAYKSLANIAPENTIGLTKALWLGDRGDLTTEERNFFTLSGTAHILAISGLHIGILFIIFKYVLDRIFKDKKGLTSLIALSMCFVYALITGLHGSSMRAIAMLSFGTLYILTQRKIDLLSTLAIAVVVILALNPDYFWDIGTQMSISVVLSILIFYKPFRKVLANLPIPPYLAQAISLILSGQVLLIPFLTIVSNRLSILLPLANLLIVPLVGIFMAISLLCFPLLFFPSISLPLLKVSEFFIFIVENLCKWFAGQNWALLTIPSISPLAIPFFIFTVYLFYKLLTAYSPKNFLYFSISMLMLIFVWRGLPSKSDVEINIFDVSHGDSILISFKNKGWLLIDGGTKEMGSKVLAPFLRANGIKAIDMVIATHADDDHIGGLFEVLNSFKVRQFLYGFGFDTQPNGKELLSTAFIQKIPSRRLNNNENIEFTNGAQLKILYSGDVLSEDTNSNSVVAKLTYKNFSILLTGDFPADKSSSYLNNNSVKALVLKIPHHGLKNSLNKDLLDLVTPKLAVSSGNEFYNGWGVRPEVKQLLKDRNIPLYRTDMFGGIRIKTNGDSFSIEGARESRGYKILKNSV